MFAVENRKSKVLKIAGGLAEIGFDYFKGFLVVTLPSKRQLFYVKPRIESADLKRGEFVVARAGSLTYEGLDQKTKQWTRLSTYGGKLVENITQAVARDCLAESMLALDAAGFDQLFTVHDEIVIEVQQDCHALKEVQEIMGRPIVWAPDLPLRAEGFETPYYLKEID